MLGDRPIGKHLIADLSGLPEGTLHDADTVMASLRDALTGAGFTILESRTHRFAGGGQGFTGVVLLSESHAAVHTYPEYDYLALDIFGCGTADPKKALASFVESLKPENVRNTVVARSPKSSGEPDREESPALEGEQIHGR